MAEKSRIKEEDEDKALESEADDVEPTPAEESAEAPKDETPSEQKSPSDEDTSSDEEVKQAENTGEEETSKKTIPEEINENADELIGEQPTEDEDQLVPTPSKLDRYQDFIDQYKQLQQNRREGGLVAGLAAAGAQAGQAMAGRYSGQFKADMTGPEMLQQQANRPVTDFEQSQVVQGRGMQLKSAMEAADPTSAQSKMVRDYLNQRIPGLKLGDNVSAADAQMLMKTMGRPQATKFSAPQPVVNQQTGVKTMAIFNTSTGSFTNLNGEPMGPEWVRDYRAQNFIDPKTQERLGFSTGTGKVTGPLTGPGTNAPIVPEQPGDLTSKQPIQLNRSFLTAQQSKQVEHARDKFIQEVKDDRNNLNSTDRVIAALQSGQELGDLPREEQDQLNRAFGQKGHISDQQVNTILGKPDWKNRFSNIVSIGMTGKLTDENRQFLLDTLKVVRDQNQQYIDNKSQIYSNNLYNDLKSSPNLQKYKFGPDSARNLLGVGSAVNPTTPSSGNPNEEIRTTKDGRKAVFNPKTKEFIRWVQ